MKTLAIIFLTIPFIVSCVPASQDDGIAAINKQIGPDGHITKTHLYVDWPAIYDGETLRARPLHLKIPVEYLTKNRWLIQGNQITSVYVKLLPGAKPSSKESSVDAYNVVIHRNDYFSAFKTRDGVINYIRKSFREGDIAGLERYLWLGCYESGKLAAGTVGRDAELAKARIASKASDDHSPENCYEDRGTQKLFTPPETTPLRAANPHRMYANWLPSKLGSRG